MERQWQLTINFPTQELRTEYLKRQEEFYEFCFEEHLQLSIQKGEWDAIQYRIPRDQPFFNDWIDSRGIVWDSENMK